MSAAPTAQNLKGADVYIIVDPDTEKDEEIRWLNAYIHFIPPVRKGTVDVMMV